jgi:AraC-like DNA-binding protein/mannose-6-phosphate isomerase-like protein (cupin superfamily)
MLLGWRVERAQASRFVGRCRGTELYRVGSCARLLARLGIGLYALRVADKPDRALYQRFPMLGQARAQVWSYLPQYRRPRHFHSEPELNLVVAGSAVFGVGESIIEVRAGELLGFPPGQDHVMLRGAGDLVLFAVGMQDWLSSEVLRKERCRTPGPLHLRPAAEEFRKLVDCVSAVAERDRADQDIAEFWERAHHARTMNARVLDLGMHVLTRRTLEAVVEEPELGREALARAARANPSEISRYFHRDFGMTLVKYRTRLRLLRFIRHVDKRAGDLTAAAIEAGFGSYSQCHRSFQSEFDCAPRQFFFSDLRERMEQAFEPLGA